MTALAVIHPLPSREPANDDRLIDVARRAHRAGAALYLRPDGQIVVAAQPLPGWTRVGVGVRERAA